MRNPPDPPRSWAGDPVVASFTGADGETRYVTETRSALDGELFYSVMTEPYLRRARYIASPRQMQEPKP